jgi:hypothetical protein
VEEDPRGTADDSERLLQLSELRRQGVLSEEEFKAAAARLLGVTPAQSVSAAEVVQDVKRPRQSGRVLDMLTSPDALMRVAAPIGVGVVVAIGACLAICISLAAALSSLAPDAFQRVPKVELFAKLGGLLYYGFQRVPLNFSGLPPSSHPRLIAQPLTGLLLMLAAFYLGGQLAARISRGSPRQRVVVAAFIALPIGIASVVAPLAFPNAPGHGPGATSLTAQLSPSPAAAFFLPFLFSLLMGIAAGAYAGYGKKWLYRPLTGIEQRVPISSALRAAAKGILLALFLGLVVTSVTIGTVLLKFPAFRHTVFTGKSPLGALFMLVLYLPNEAIVAFLGSLGVPLHTTVPFAPKVTQSFGYGQHLPPVAWGALIVPIIATVTTGYLAARFSGGSSRRRVAAGVLASVPFTVAWWLLGYLAGIRVVTGVDVVSSNVLSIEPSATAVFFLVPLWSVIGCWIGSLVWLSRKHPSSVQTEPAIPGAT